MLDKNGMDRVAETAFRAQTQRISQLEDLLARYYQQHKIKGAHCICQLCRETKESLAASLLDKVFDKNPAWVKAIMD